MPILSIIMGLLNLKKIIPFLIENWKPIIILCMAAVLAYQNLSGTRFLFGAETIPSLNMQLSAANKAIATCKAGNDTLAASIDERNTEVQKWKDITTSLKSDIGTLQDNLTQARTVLTTEVDKILEEKAPETCDAAIDYLRDGRKDLKWDD